MTLGILRLTAVLGLFASAGMAGASTISLEDLNTSTVRGSISCDACSAALFDLLGTDVLSFSTLIGDVVAGPGNSSPTSQTTFVNTALGTSFPIGTQTSPAVGGTAYDITSAYVLLHIGGGSSHLGYFLLQNTSLTGTFTFTYTKDPNGNGGGLSNFTQIGVYTPPGTSAVPLPAGGLLLISSLGGLGLLRRWKKRA